MDSTSWPSSQRLLQRLWHMACEYDNIRRVTTFAVFSEHNPYTHAHNAILAALYALDREVPRET